MADWSVQNYFEDAKVGDEIPSYSLLLTPQRLIMAAGAVRDFAPLHSQPDFAKSTGAKDMYVNNQFVMMAFYRLLQEYAGLDGKVLQIGPLRMTKYACANDTITYTGTITELFEDERGACVKVAFSADNQDGENTAKGEGLLTLPRR